MRGLFEFLIALVMVLASVGIGLHFGNEVGTRVGHAEGYSQGFADGRELGMDEVQTPEYTRATCTEWWHGSKREAKKMVDKYCEVTK